MWLHNTEHPPQFVKRRYGTQILLNSFLEEWSRQVRYSIGKYSIRIMYQIVLLGVCHLSKIEKCFPYSICRDIVKSIKDAISNIIPTRMSQQQRYSVHFQVFFPYPAKYLSNRINYFGMTKHSVCRFRLKSYTSVRKLMIHLVPFIVRNWSMAVSTIHR